RSQSRRSRGRRRARGRYDRYGRRLRPAEGNEDNCGQALGRAPSKPSTLHTMSINLALGRFATQNATAIVFIAVILCAAGVYAALTMPSSVFPQTNFPRCVILIDNGVMPADEMMATITRPIEEAMKDVPGAAFVRSATGRGSAEVSVFFNWQADMIQSELYVNSRLAQVRSTLPATATAVVWRLTFSAFPIIGVS